MKMNNEYIPAIPIMKRDRFLYYYAPIEHFWGYYAPDGEIGINLYQKSLDVEGYIRDLIDTLIHEIIHYVCPECTHDHIKYIVKILRSEGVIP